MPPRGAVSSALPATVDEGDGPMCVTVTGATSVTAVFALRKELTIAVSGFGVAGAVEYVLASDFALTIAAEGAVSFARTPVGD